MAHIISFGVEGAKMYFDIAMWYAEAYQFKVSIYDQFSREIKLITLFYTFGDAYDIKSAVNIIRYVICYSMT